MFRRIHNNSNEFIQFQFEGRPVSAKPGETVAAALLSAGVRNFRKPSGDQKPRGPYCMIGVCFDCRVVINGVPDRQACQIEATPGLQVTRQTGMAVSALEGASL